jgi:PPK2 family polyphosphate:nucleotide phosphotransferase
VSASAGWTSPPHELLRVRAGFRLADLDASAKPGWTGDRAAGERRSAELGTELSELQERLYAQGRSGGTRAVLLVLQGMDTSGKGGIVRHVLGMVDPQGVQHRAFGVPTDAEREHDFLWRIRAALPAPGRIGVFDRSHYEDVVVVRVHGLVPEPVWRARYDQINEFEAEVSASGTTIVKVLLAVSPQEQKARLRERLERPDKHWKYNPGDLDERARWPEYQDAYQEVLDRTASEIAPWYVVPADSKWYARLAVTELLRRTMRGLDLTWPEADFDVGAELARLDAQP